jgi:thiamine transporter
MYDVVVNDWGETTYVPTTLGNVVLALILIVLLIGAVFFARKYAAKQAQSDENQTGGKLTAKQLAFCAAAIALGTILSNIKLFHLPTGGSITLISMLVVCLPGYFFGLGAGLLSAVAYGILQLLLGPYVLYPMQLVVDYILAFGALGLSGLFCNAKHGLIKGYLAGILGRYVFSVISGWIFFGSYAWDGWSALPYSLVYNALYIFAEAIITVIILLIPAVSKGLARVKAMALS